MAGRGGAGQGRAWLGMVRQGAAGLAATQRGMEFHPPQPFPNVRLPGRRGLLDDLVLVTRDSPGRRTDLDFGPNVPGPNPCCASKLCTSPTPDVAVPPPGGSGAGLAKEPTGPKPAPDGSFRFGDLGARTGGGAGSGDGSTEGAGARATLPPSPLPNFLLGCALAIVRTYSNPLWPNRSAGTGPRCRWPYSSKWPVAEGPSQRTLRCCGCNRGPR